MVRSAEAQHITPQMIADGVTAMLWFLLVGSIVFTLLFLLFAYKAREGTRSARTVLTVLPIVMLLLILTFAPVLTYLTLVAVLRSSSRWCCCTCRR